MKLLLLDKDGTLVVPKSGAKFVNQAWDQELIPGVAEVLNRYVADGWTPIIISNQGGIAAGHKSLEATISEMGYCCGLFPFGATPQESFFCPDFEGEICHRHWAGDSITYDRSSWEVIEYGLAGTFRKPNPGMLKLAISIHQPDEVLYVGDMTIANSQKGEDENAAISAGIPFMSAENWRTKG